MAEATTAPAQAGSIIIPTDAEIEVVSDTRDTPAGRVLSEKRPARPLAPNGRPIGNPNHSDFYGEHVIPRGRRKGEKQKVQFIVMNNADIDPKEAAELIHNMNPDHYGTKLQLRYSQEEKATTVASDAKLAALVTSPDRVREVPQQLEGEDGSGQVKEL